MIRIPSVVAQISGDYIKQISHKFIYTDQRSLIIFIFTTHIINLINTLINTRFFREVKSHYVIL